MNAEPRYNDKYYQHTTSHSQIVDVVQADAISLNDVSSPIDWGMLFGNANPVEIEIGFGKGRFLLEASKQFAAVNFIGVERAQKYVEITRQRFFKYMQHFSVDKNSGIFENVRLAWTDANYFLSRFVPENSVRAYHVYFPDPWPKVRQQKRRIFRNKEFLDSISRTLTLNDGKLYVVTDYSEYFNEIQERLANQTELIPISSNMGDYQDIATNFEIKYRLEGRNIYRAVYEKKEQREFDNVSLL